MLSGFFQVPIKESSKYLTAFITPKGLFEFNRLPFGLTNSPATFSRLVQNVLGHLYSRGVLNYLDDIVVHTKTFDEHLKMLDTMLDTIYKANLRLKITKCVFAYNEIKLLGFRVGKDGITTDPDKIKAVIDFPKLRNQRDVRAFLGLTGYYRIFVKGFAEIATPLHNLLKNDVAFVWKDEHEKAFQQLKERLTTSPCLRHFDPNLPLVVSCDASNYGVGATLANLVNKKEQPVGFVSRSLNKHERNYTTTEKECLAAVFALRKFRHLLLGRKFKILTDNCALCYLRNLKDPQSRLARWAIALSDFNYEIVYKKGKLHNNVDCLSRYPTGAAPDEVEEEIPSVFSADVEFDIRQLQQDDAYCKAIIEQLKQNTDRSNFVIVNNVLYRKFVTDIGEEQLLVLPLCLVNRVLENLHDSSLCGHLGLAKTWQRIKCRYFRPGLRTAMIRYVQSCDLCQRRKDRSQKKFGFLQTPRFSNKLNEIVGVDCIGPLPETPRKNRYIVIGVDHCTRFVEAEAVPDIKADRIAQFLFTHYILKHGVMKCLVTDRGSNFTSKIINNLLEIMKSRHILTSSYHPQSNGITERVNRPLKAIMTMYVSHMQFEWDTYLQSALFAINSSVHEATGYSPYFLMHGQTPAMPIDEVLSTDNPKTQIHRAARLIKTFRKKAKEKLLLSHLRNKKLYDEHRKEHKFKIGDLVLRKRGQVKQGDTPKLAHQYDGPFIVINKYGENTLQIMNLDPKTLQRWKYDVVPVDRIKMYVERNLADPNPAKEDGAEATAGESSSSEEDVEIDNTRHSAIDHQTELPTQQVEPHTAASGEAENNDAEEAHVPPSEEPSALQEDVTNSGQPSDAANINNDVAQPRRSNRLVAKPRVSYHYR